jgi:hypothetical protein
VLIELMLGHEGMDRGLPEGEAYRSALDLYEEFTGGTRDELPRALPLSDRDAQEEEDGSRA